MYSLAFYRDTPELISSCSTITSIAQCPPAEQARVAYSLQVQSQGQGAPTFPHREATKHQQCKALGNAQQTCIREKANAKLHVAP